MSEKFKLEGSGKGPKDRTTGGEKKKWDECPLWAHIEEKKKKAENDEKRSDKG